MINKVTLLLAFAIIAANNLFAQKIVTIPVTTKDNAMVLQTDKDNRLWIVHFFCNSALISTKIFSNSIKRITCWFYGVN